MFNKPYPMWEVKDSPVEIEIKFLDDLNIYDIGNTIQITGILYADKDDLYISLLPEYQEDSFRVKILNMNLEDWNRFFRQTDAVETEIFAENEKGKLVKTIVRKTERMIDQHVCWKVFQRDQYKCRYCGKTGIPLTIDHAVLWEEGGPTIEENLVSSCRKCNKIRGNIQYKEWLESEYYKKISKHVSKYNQAANEMLLDNLKNIPIKRHKKTR